MAELIRMPRLSDTMAEGKIVSWNKKVGDKIKPGDVLAEVETDKAVMELESYNEGTLLYIGVQGGSAAKVDDVLAIVGKQGEDYKAALNNAGAAGTKEAQVNKNDSAAEKTGNEVQPSRAEAPKPTAAAKKIDLPAGAKEIRMPLLSDTMTEGKIITWNKKLGDSVKADDVLAEVETDKATMDVVGYEEGTLLYIGAEAGKAAQVNEIIAIVGKPGTDVNAYVEAEKAAPATGGAAKQPGIQNGKPEATDQQPEANNAKEQIKENKSETGSEHAETGNVAEGISTGRIKASPLAKKLAAEKGIDISRVNGSGDNGRVIKKDVDDFKEVAAAPSAPIQQAPKAAAFAPAAEEGYTDQPLSQMRAVIARRLGESMFSAPHFYLTMEITMDNAITARTAMNGESTVKISFNDMLIKACATALRRHPAVNSSWISAGTGDFIRQNHHIHIGSALALPEGLIVPVIKFADQKTLSQIAAEAKALYAKAKEKKLQPAEFSGNTFTISNLGMMDIDEFTAIINPPDSCILAVGRIKETVVKKDNGFAVSNVMKVTMSCDHRSVDGAVGAAFLQTLKKYMENPVMMLV